MLQEAASADHATLLAPAVGVPSVSVHYDLQARIRSADSALLHAGVIDPRSRRWARRGARPGGDRIPPARSSATSRRGGAGPRASLHRRPRGSHGTRFAHVDRRRYGLYGSLDAPAERSERLSRLPRVWRSCLGLVVGCDPPPDRPALSEDGERVSVRNRDDLPGEGARRAGAGHWVRDPATRARWRRTFGRMAGRSKARCG